MVTSGAQDRSSSNPGPSPDSKIDTPPPAPDYHPVDAQPAQMPRTPMRRLIARVKGILLAPKREWPVVAGEASTRSDIYVRYVAPLAVLGAIASLIGSAVVGIPVPPQDTVRLGPGAAVAAAMLHFALTFATVFVVAIVVDALAPTFGGRRNSLAALKVTAYSFTPAWVAAVLTILPAFGAIAGVIGLYGLYLLYLGLPIVMQAPVDKSLGYTVVIVICTVVVSIAVAMASGLLLGVFMPPDAGAPDSGTASAAWRSGWI